MNSNSSKNVLLVFAAIIVLTIVSALIALPGRIVGSFTIAGRTIPVNLSNPGLHFQLGPWRVDKTFELKKGLDIQGGMQVVLDADMTDISEEDRVDALESVKEVIARRVDLFGINEPVVLTSISGNDYRVIVELAGVTDSAQALKLLGTTAQLDFRLPSEELLQNSDATQSASVFIESFEPTGLSGQQLRRASVEFNQTTGEPVVSLEFDADGREMFATLTQEHTGEVMAIFLDDYPVTMPVIQTPIIDGRAQISGSFTVESAKELAIQLNAGALPVPVSILEQKTIGASLGQASIEASVKAGLIGISLVMLFMILYYGVKGFLASMALVVYSILTLAVYKVVGITLTLPGIAGLLLSIGMAVDANILIFERMKEELRLGRSFGRAMELGFGRAWDSIKDANLATILTALVLINPLDFTFLNTSGLVRGFGLTLLIGVIISLFTGVVVTRTFMRLFLKPIKE